MGPIEGQSDGQMKDLMQTIARTSHQEGSAVLGSEFYMSGYKVIPCSKTVGHDWTACPFSHANEKAARRCPVAFAYTAIACPDMKKAGECPRAEKCMFAHNVFEYWLHPTRYRTQTCSYGTNCRRSVCFFAHTADEVRVVEKSAQLIALESQLGAVDSAFGLPGNAGSTARSASLGNRPAQGAAAASAPLPPGTPRPTTQQLQQQQQHVLQLAYQAQQMAIARKAAAGMLPADPAAMGVLQAARARLDQQDTHHVPPQTPQQAQAASANMQATLQQMMAPPPPPPPARPTAPDMLRAASLPLPRPQPGAEQQQGRMLHAGLAQTHQDALSLVGGPQDGPASRQGVPPAAGASYQDFSAPLPQHPLLDGQFRQPPPPPPLRTGLNPFVTSQQQAFSGGGLPPQPRHMSPRRNASCLQFASGGSQQASPPSQQTRMSVDHHAAYRPPYSSASGLAGQQQQQHLGQQFAGQQQQRMSMELQHGRPPFPGGQHSQQLPLAQPALFSGQQSPLSPPRSFSAALPGPNGGASSASEDLSATLRLLSEMAGHPAPGGAGDPLDGDSQNAALQHALLLGVLPQLMQQLQAAAATLPPPPPPPPLYAPRPQYPPVGRAQSFGHAPQSLLLMHQQLQQAGGSVSAAPTSPHTPPQPGMMAKIPAMMPWYTSIHGAQSVDSSVDSFDHAASNLLFSVPDDYSDFSTAGSHALSSGQALSGSFGRALSGNGMGEIDSLMHSLSLVGDHGAPRLPPSGPAETYLNGVGPGCHTASFGVAETLAGPSFAGKREGMDALARRRSAFAVRAHTSY